MDRFPATLKVPAIIGLIVVLPFMLLEYVNRRGFHEGYPVAVFALLWVLGTGFSFALLPILRDLRAGKSLLRSTVGLALRVASLIASAWLWISIVADQMPCFLGVPLCD